MSQVENELLKIAKLSPDKYSDRQDYLAALCRKIEKMSQGQFQSLSDDAYSWYEKAFDAFNNEKELPEFPDHEPLDELLEGNVGRAEGYDSQPTETIMASSLETQSGLITDPQKSKGRSRTGVPRYDAITGEKDKWGIIKGTKTSDAMAMLEQGASMKEVETALGGKYYNALRGLVKDGHKLEKFENGKLKLTHKDVV